MTALDDSISLVGQFTFQKSASYDDYRERWFRTIFFLISFQGNLRRLDSSSRESGERRTRNLEKSKRFFSCFTFFAHATLSARRQYFLTDYLRFSCERRLRRVENSRGYIMRDRQSDSWTAFWNLWRRKFRHYLMCVYSNVCTSGASRTKVMRDLSLSRRFQNSNCFRWWNFAFLTTSTPSSHRRNLSNSPPQVLMLHVSFPSHWSWKFIFVCEFQRCFAKQKKKVFQFRRNNISD